MTLLDLARLTRANAVMILVLLLTGVGAAYLITVRMPHVYQADASGYVRVAGAAESTGEGIAATTLSGSKAESYLPIVDSRAVAQRVIDETGIDASPAEVAGRVSASVAPNSRISLASERASASWALYFSSATRASAWASSACFIPPSMAAARSS